MNYSKLIMPVKVGINGFGRIGRIFLRTCFQKSDITVSAINDPAIKTEYICYLIKFDSTHGTFKGTVIQNGDDIKINDQIIKIFHEKLPSNVPWQTADVEYIVEASGMFTNLEKASGHLASETVKRVLVTAPSADIPMMILGVNEDKIVPEHKVISCTSSTLYCLAPIIKILEDHFGVAEGFITSIHAMTPSLKPLDGLCLRGKHWRDHRSILQNIIPATTSACKTLGKIIPEIKDRMSGLAFRVPVVDVSVLDMTIRLNVNTSLSKIIKNIEEASKFRMRDIIKISREEAVSSDFIGDSHSCILDVGSSLQLKPNFFKLICWYENEYSYACRIVNSIMFSEHQFYKFQLPSKLAYVRPRVFKRQDVLLQTETHCRDCSPEINSKKISSLSQNIGFKSKPPSNHRTAVLKKPFPLHNTGNVKIRVSDRESKTRNEIFKIWNDSPESKGQSAPLSHKKNRSAFFHSCIYIAQNAKNIESMKGRDRLENAKRKFSKMVNITEDLLEKSYSKKLQSNYQISRPKNDTNVNQPELTKETPVPDKDIKMIPCLCYGEKSTGESNDSLMTFDNNNHEESFSNHFYDSNNTNHKSLSLSTSNSNIYRILSGTDILLKQPDDNSNFKNGNLPKGVAENVNNQENTNEKIVFKEQLAKTVNTLINEVSQNNQVQYDLNCNGKFSNTYDNSHKISKNIIHFDKNTIKANPEVKVYNSDASAKIENTNSMNCFSKYSSCNSSLPKQQTSTKTFNETELIDDFKKKKNGNMRIVDEELKKRNIRLLDTKVFNNREPIVFNPYYNSLAADDKYSEGTELKMKILKKLNRFATEPVVSQEVLRCLSPNHPEQDIFDKLDSTSETESNDSFEIKKRKSQVIQINDLTNSLEDLSRLDKICRIIEISDELSDQLFSALDNPANRFDTKKWSFQDLCERIKLDEFFSKVFEKNVGGKLVKGSKIETKEMN